MALTRVADNNRGIKFRNQFIREFVRGDMFKKYKSEDANAIIRVYVETGKTGGDEINVPLVFALGSGGVGSGPLEGNEEKIGNSGFRIRIDWKRNAALATKAEIKKQSFDLFGQASALLSEWGSRIQRDETVIAYMAIPSTAPQAGLGSDYGNTVAGVRWADALPAQKNAWLTANNDRVLFGNLRSNTVAGNVASSLANITVANGKASAKTVRLAKARALLTSPRIAPVTTDDGYERFVWFVGANAFRDLMADPEIYAANKDARPREGGTYKNNPIFNDGDLLYNGVIIRQVPEISSLLGPSFYGAGNGGVVGTSSNADVEPSFFCGQNSLAWVWGEMPEPTKRDDTDYQFLKGIGIEMAYAAGKIAATTADGRFVDWGVFTVFVNAAPDA